MTRIIILLTFLTSSSSFASKYIKNTTVGQKVWVGNQINAGVCFLIPASEENEFSQDDEVLTAIGSGEGLIAKDAACADTIAGVSDAISFLRGDAMTDSDGAILSRTKVTESGWAYQLRSFEITTCKLGGSLEMEPDGTDPNFFVMKYYDNTDTELVQGGSETDADFQIRLDTSCKRTIADWTPTWDYEIIGGQMRQQNAPVNDVRVWIIGVPGIPAFAGGSKVFINNANMKFMAQSETLAADGRAPKKLLYNNPVPGTNTLRYQFINAGLGVKHVVQVSMEVFKP